MGEMGMEGQLAFIYVCGFGDACERVVYGSCGRVLQWPAGRGVIGDMVGIMGFDRTACEYCGGKALSVFEIRQVEGHVVCLMSS